MSFIYSQALEAAYWGGNCSDTEPSALLSGNPTPRLSLSHDKTMDVSRLSRFGMTCKPLTESRGAELLMSYLAGFHAKTLQSAEKVRASMAKDRVCGHTWLGLLAKYDPDTHSLKTAQHSLLEDSTGCLPTLPASGLMLDGECFQASRREHRLKENAFSLPAPTKSMGKRGWGISNVKPRYSQTVEKNARLFGYKPHPSVLEWSMGWIPMWTRLAPLGTVKFQSWQQQHGACFQENKNG